MAGFVTGLPKIENTLALSTLEYLNKFQFGNGAERAAIIYTVTCCELYTLESYLFVGSMFVDYQNAADLLVHYFMGNWIVRCKTIHKFLYASGDRNLWARVIHEIHKH